MAHLAGRFAEEKFERPFAVNLDPAGPTPPFVCPATLPLSLARQEKCRKIPWRAHRVPAHASPSSPPPHVPHAAYSFREFRVWRHVLMTKRSGYVAGKSSCLVGGQRLLQSREFPRRRLLRRSVCQHLWTLDITPQSAR